MQLVKKVDKSILTILPVRHRRSSGSSPLLPEGLLRLEEGAAGGAAATVAAATAEDIQQLG